MDVVYKRLPLEGVTNVRDLGGFNLSLNSLTRYREFVRSESPSELTERDLLFLKEYGITLVLDFRSINECKKNPSKLRNCSWLKYIQIPTFSTKMSPVIDVLVNWGEKYIELLECNKEWICKVMWYLAYSEGTVLYNCTTGKDRTGVITALILKLVGVAECDIIADYCISQAYLSKKYPIIFKDLSNYIDFSEPFFKTEPESMEKMLRFIEEKYGNIINYLYTCDISTEVICRIRKKLCG